MKNLLSEATQNDDAGGQEIIHGIISACAMYWNLSDREP
jgi:hypothetical protein